jgi:hypothetical protein
MHSEIPVNFTRRLIRRTSLAMIAVFGGSMLRVMSAPSKLRSVGQAEQRNYGKTTVGG